MNRSRGCRSWTSKVSSLFLVFLETRNKLNSSTCSDAVYAGCQDQEPQEYRGVYWQLGHEGSGQLFVSRQKPKLNMQAKLGGVTHQVPISELPGMVKGKTMLLGGNLGFVSCRKQELDREADFSPPPNSVSSKERPLSPVPSRPTMPTVMPILPKSDSKKAEASSSSTYPP